MSLLHGSIVVSTGLEQLHKTIDFYDHTKYGADVIDQMTHKRRLKDASRRWPVQVRQRS